MKKYGQIKTSQSEEKSNSKKQNDILLIRLADFINNVVGRRKLPENVNEKLLGTFVCFHEIFFLYFHKFFSVILLGKPAVIMKLDIEGSEVEVVEDLIMQGSLQYLDVMMVEFHTWMAKGNKKLSLRNFK